MNDRAGDPTYYLTQNYEVNRILQAPTTEPRFILDTYVRDTHYAFASDQQRDQVRSSILLCLDLKFPCALVISSNEKSAFRVKDSEVLSFVRFIGEMIHYDLLDGNFHGQIRQLKPGLFPPGQGQAIPS